MDLTGVPEEDAVGKEVVNMHWVNGDTRLIED